MIKKAIRKRKLTPVPEPLHDDAPSVYEPVIEVAPPPPKTWWQRFLDRIASYP